MVGEEQRLDWAQVLRDSATALRLPYLRYAAAPQQPFEAAYLVPGVTAPVMSTTMEVQAGLVHEVDLLRLIAKLREEAPGFFGVTGCTLDRVGQRRRAGARTRRISRAAAGCAGTRSRWPAGEPG